MAKASNLRALLGAAAIAVLAANQAEAQTVGVNAAVAGDVRMSTDANRAVHPAVVKERVSLGNDILTGRGSRLQVLLLDHTMFTVGASARIKVDRFVYDPNRSSSAVGLSVARGAFRFMSGKPTHANPGQSSIRTPSASIGIRGTIVEGVIGAEAIRIARQQAGLPAFTANPELATLILLRGPGPATQGDEVPGAIDVDAGGKTVSLTGSGTAVFIPGPGEAPIGPFALTDWGSAYLASLTGTGGFGAGGPWGLTLEPNPLEDLLAFDVACDGRGGGLGDPVKGPPAGGGCGGGPKQ